MTTLHRDEPPAAPAGPAPRERMLAGLAVTERRLRVAGVSTAVLEAGDGPPLVLLHGGIECGGAYWAPVIARLAASHRLVVPDVPGLGESEPLARLDEATFADWLGSLARSTCEQRPTLIAHSLLGTPATRFAARRATFWPGWWFTPRPAWGTTAYRSRFA